MDTTTCAPELEPSTPGRQNTDREPTPAPGSATKNISTQENVPQPSGLPSPICFRISGIPPHWDSKDVMDYLTNHIDRELDWSTAKLSGPFPSPFDDTQCALLGLDCCTNSLSTRFSHQHNVEHPVVEVNRETFHMVIDRHFYDLTPMNKPTLPIVADVIAITGLGGHVFGFWRSRQRTFCPINRPMWIHDFLPKSFPNTRIMTYGYDCSLVHPNDMRMWDYVIKLEVALNNARRYCQDRKIVFIGHSLGGILIIQIRYDS
ncbi:hypothetical protein P167DRAFT_610160 [Morchella conica CCBAS932]|uniref:DUF676 domain-containing protein n=1 Tax=Morchella conica CCBAS932 TaxID=1392247 RepID=A0A3N4K6Z5_9PEZI|nr:hypothetical protein P167DRAFT_610160 [Morchella conica CCBAS932]